MGDRPYLSRHRTDLVIASAMALVAFAALWFRHATFRSASYDLAVFEQVVWKMAHGRGATSTLTAWNAFGDHLSPILLVFVPLYRLAATPLWLFAAQSLAIGVGVLCIRPLCEAVGVNQDRPWVPSVLMAAYVLSPAVWNASMFDFHPTTMALPVLMVGCIAALRQQHRVMWLAFLGLIILRDDLALAALPLACIGWTSDTRTGHRMRAALAGAGIAWTLIGAQVGTALGASRHFEARYGYLGDSMTDAVTHPLHAVTGVIEHLFIPENAFLAAAFLLPFAFIPLARPAWCALAGFMALPVMLASDANFHLPTYHYGAPLVPFLLLAAAGALKEAHSLAPRRVVTFAVTATAAVGLTLMGPTMTAALTTPSVNPADARAAIATVKTSDVVVAGSLVGPHLANRDTLVPFPFPFLKGEPDFPLDPEVMSTSPEKQALIDVVVIAAKANNPNDRTIEHFLADPVVRAEFVREDFGSVLVFRRIGK